MAALKHRLIDTDTLYCTVANHVRRVSKAAIFLQVVILDGIHLPHTLPYYIACRSTFDYYLILSPSSMPHPLLMESH